MRVNLPNFLVPAYRVLYATASRQVVCKKTFNEAIPFERRCSIREPRIDVCGLSPSTSSSSGTSTPHSTMHDDDQGNQVHNQVVALAGAELQMFRIVKLPPFWMRNLRSGFVKSKPLSG